MKKYAGVLVRYDNKCLLCKRSAGQSRGGEWSIPAGHVEKDESPKDGARREFYEETDKTIGTLKFAGMIKRYNREASKIKGLMYVYFSDSPEEITPNLETAKDGAEHTECGYFGKDELPTPVSDQLKKLIHIVLK
jgi:ADP-ribose pyrophosphatase YjhB (NUDIX family)